MRFFLFIVALFFHFYFANCQYFSKIYKAEEYILNSKFDSAIHIYSQLQENKYRLRSNDCYNMTLCYLYLNNLDAVFNNVDSCIIKGYTIDFFNSKLFNRLHNDFRWNNFKVRYDSLRSIYLSYYQDSSYIRILKMVIQDQDISKSKNKEADSIYYCHGIQLCNMIKRHQIPEFELFDFDIPGMRNSIPAILVRHYFGTVNKTKSLRNRNKFAENIIVDSCFYHAILQMIQMGQFSPYVFRFGLEYSNPEELFGNNDIFIYSKLSTENSNFTPQNLEEVKILAEIKFTNPFKLDDEIRLDKNRIEVGLPTLSHEIKIANYCDSTNQIYGNDKKYGFQFLFQTRIQQYYFGSKQISFTEDADYVNVSFFNGKGEQIDIKKIPKNHVLKFINFE